MTQEQQVEAMQRMAAEIILAIERGGGVEDVLLVLGALGSVMGTIAVATGRPEECMQKMVEVSRAIISGEILGRPAP